jgi:hypothetical protein
MSHMSDQEHNDPTDSDLFTTSRDIDVLMTLALGTMLRRLHAGDVRTADELELIVVTLGDIFWRLQDGCV